MLQNMKHIKYIIYFNCICYKNRCCFFFSLKSNNDFSFILFDDIVIDYLTFISVIVVIIWNITKSILILIVISMEINIIIDN